LELGPNFPFGSQKRDPEMQSESQETREIELELILQTWDGIFPGGCPRLDSNYFLEDRRVQGGGLVISEDMPVTGNLDRAIHDFLSPIENNADVLRAFSPLLRVAVYNRAVTCSLHTASLPLIVRFGAELEIKVFPTAGDTADSH
jgi:hypothetical protein